MLSAVDSVSTPRIFTAASLEACEPVVGPSACVSPPLSEPVVSLLVCAIVSWCRLCRSIAEPAARSGARQPNFVATGGVGCGA